MARAAKLDLRAFQRELAVPPCRPRPRRRSSRRGSGLACGGDRWLMRLADAGEVVTMPEIVPVPLTRPWYLGVSNIRGNLYSVIDFGRFLGRESQPGAGQARLVLFGPRTGDMNAGLVVTRVLGLAQRRRAGARGAAAGRAGVVRATVDGRRRQRMAGNRPRDPRQGSGVPASRTLGRASGIDASEGENTWRSNCGNLFGGEKAKPRSRSTSTCRPRRSRWPRRCRRATTRSASVSIMEQLRTAHAPTWRRRASCG